MKENSIKNEQSSIEEDIKNAEHFIKSIKTDKEYKEENGWHGYYNKEIVELARILQHILSDYKRVLEINEVLLKENEELKNDYENLSNSVVVKNYCIKNSIPIQKIKDKIEEYKNEIDKLYNQKVWNEPMDTIYKNRYVNYINILQELLESEE